MRFHLAVGTIIERTHELSLFAREVVEGDGVNWRYRVGDCAASPPCFLRSAPQRWLA